MIQLDTSLLVDAFTGQQRSAGALRAAIESGEVVLMSSIVLYEWLRGPRIEAELVAQEGLFPRALAVPFGPDEARRAADVYRGLGRRRGRGLDIAIAACALTDGATLWTLNPGDFDDIPGLVLYRPARA